MEEIRGRRRFIQRVMDDPVHVGSIEMQRRRGRPIDAGVVGDEDARPHIAGVVIDDSHFAITEPREGKQYFINQRLLHFFDAIPAFPMPLNERAHAKAMLSLPGK